MGSIFKRHGRSATGLGDDAVPSWCWNQASFKACADQQLIEAQGGCQRAGNTKAGCPATVQQGLISATCVPDCLSKQPTDPGPVRAGAMGVPTIAWVGVVAVAAIAAVLLLKKKKATPNRRRHHRHHRRY